VGDQNKYVINLLEFTVPNCCNILKLRSLTIGHLLPEQLFTIVCGCYFISSLLKLTMSERDWP